MIFHFQITMSDGRILIGVFLCVDRDCNVIVGNCSEYLNEADLEVWADARILGLALVPGKHIVQICEDVSREEETSKVAGSATCSAEETQPLLSSNDNLDVSPQETQPNNVENPLSHSHEQTSLKS